MNHEILENMTITLKPKMIFQGLGDAGVEDTFLSIVKSAEKLTRCHKRSGDHRGAN
jgi:hypothetical protein